MEERRPEDDDPELDYQLFLIRHGISDDPAPAEWWEEQVSRLDPKHAERARRALDHITGPRCLPVDVLVPLSQVSDSRTSPSLSRRRYQAQVRDLRALAKPVKNLIHNLTFGDADDQLWDAVRVLHTQGPKRLREATAEVERMHRDPKGATNRAILTLLRTVARRTGSPHYSDVSVLLSVVSIKRTVGALKQLVLREGGLGTRKRAKVVPRPKRPRGRPRKPNAIRNKGDREVLMSNEQIDQEWATKRRSWR